MNILFISHIFPNPYANTFGIFVQNQLMMLRDHKVIDKADVVIPVFTKEGKWLLEHDLDKRKIYSLREGALNQSYVRGTTCINWPGLNVIIILFRIIWLVKKLRSEKQYDLIHAHFAYPDGVIAAILSKLFSIPMVMTCHGSDIFRFAKRMWASVLVRMACRQAKRIFCVSNALATEVKLITPEKDKVIVTYNGVNLSHFHPRMKSGTLPNLNFSKIVMYVGNLRKAKGVMDLLMAFSVVKEKVDDVRLVFVGDGDCRKEMEEYISSNKLEGFVMIAGSIEHQHIPSWMCAASVLILPSHSEGFGIVLVEALACGVPVIGTAVGGIPEIINSPEVGIVVPPAKPEALAETIIMALDKTWNKEKLVQRAQEFSATRLTATLSGEYKAVSKAKGNQ